MDYKEYLRVAVGEGWRVPITQPVDHAAWIDYWALRGARAAGDLRGPEPKAPDGITFMERAQARSLGRTRYWTGRQCVNGHLAPRYVTSGACSLCVAAAQRRVAKQRPDLVTVRVLVHRDDAPMIEQTAEALNAARGL